MLVSFPVICFGYTAHAVLLPIVRALRNPTRARVRASVRGALALCTLTYFTVGLFGYLAFRCADLPALSPSLKRGVGLKGWDECRHRVWLGRLGTG